MSVDLSGEITAIATAALAAFTTVTAIYAILAFRKQTEEVRTIQEQARGADSRRREPGNG